jgi:negative regulator of sigma-B (phosphoserine phosphatase)
MAAMSELCPSEHPVIEWGVAGRPLGADESGDLHVVAPFPGGALVGVIDGLGHGPEAAAAAHAARLILEENPGDALEGLLVRCHEGIRHTRGVVMSLAAFDVGRSSMTWLGVGNVDAILLREPGTQDRAHESVVNRGGVVGYRLPALSPRTLAVRTGDLLIMATDGIRNGFPVGVDRGGAPDVTAGLILAGFGRGTDDALVLVARYLGAVA